MLALDHLIVRVRDAEETVAFWARYLGIVPEGVDGPFHVVRVSESTTIQFAPWGTEGNEHFAFALAPGDFDASFARLREDGIPFGDSFHDVGNQQGPGTESGARGPGRTVYFFDPNRHLLEIRSYT
jgi:catechol 2,3-dioxygenase-like lactoylglutathione lyase family enzyme